MTYWESVGRQNSRFIFTQQIRREATVSIIRNGIVPSELKSLLPFSKENVPLPNRRVLRYGAHGIHEYRGKFFPQLVRSLLNIERVKAGDIVLDPMCGSGTAPVESMMLGCSSYAADLNPLSVLISRTKCALLGLDPEILEREYELLSEDLQKGRCKANGRWLESLDGKDQNYLTNWFSSRVLSELDSLAVRVHATANPTCRDLFRVSLSNILRRVSWQKNDDLRVRKDVNTDTEVNVKAEFLAEVFRTVKAVLAFLYGEGKFRTGQAEIIQGDARTLAANAGPFHKLRGRVKVAITSPPYAMALPYLDTDRLSLCYLGLLSRPDHRSLDYEMIGNREITEKRRRTYLEYYAMRKSHFPKEISSLIYRIHRLNEFADVGFRRRNMASLLTKYFADMKAVFHTANELLKKGSCLYLVIGNNRTVAGGKIVEIETDKLLALVAEQEGLKLEGSFPMEMLVSRDIFKTNSVKSEKILALRKKSIR